jgi:hypothetical protein
MAFMLDRVVATGSLVIRQVGGDRAGEMRVHRFLSSPEVEVGEIVATAGMRTAGACGGRRIVAVQDTTEINFAGRSAKRRGFGAGANGEAPAFFIHATVAVDAEDEALLGVLTARVWTRGAGRVGPRLARGFRDRESWRWVDGMETAASLLAGSRVVMVADREADGFAQFVRRPHGSDLIVRAAQNRRVAPSGHVFDAAAAWPELGRHAITVPARWPATRARAAMVSVRAGAVTLMRPRTRPEPGDPAELTLNLVEVTEIDPPAGLETVCWRLLTTLPVGDFAAACEVARLYRLRWRIEQVFRALKSDGLRLEDVQIEAAGRMMKHAAIGLVAAARTIQLVDARDGGKRPATDVVDETLLDAAAAIGRSKEGKTVRQKNPHPPRSLAWLAWIIARLGGWNCYYKPPGPKTMRQGCNQFAAMATGFLLANQPNVP